MNIQIEEENLRRELFEKFENREDKNAIMIKGTKEELTKYLFLHLAIGFWAFGDPEYKKYEELDKDDKELVDNSELLIGKREMLLGYKIGFDSRNRIVTQNEINKLKANDVYIVVVSKYEDGYPYAISSIESKSGKNERIFHNYFGVCPQGGPGDYSEYE
jgi:hypothetical protein